MAGVSAARLACAPLHGGWFQRSRTLLAEFEAGFGRLRLRRLLLLCLGIQLGCIWVTGSSVLDSPDTCATWCAGPESLRGPIYRRGSGLLDPLLTASAVPQRPFLPFYWRLHGLRGMPLSVLVSLFLSLSPLRCYLFIYLSVACTVCKL